MLALLCAISPCCEPPRGLDAGAMERAPRDSGSGTETPAPLDAGTPRRADPALRSVEGACEGRARVRPGPGAAVFGARAGPALMDLWITRRGRWLGATRTRLCASEDEGRSFHEVLALGAPVETRLEPLDSNGPWLLVARAERAPGARNRGPIVGAWWSLDPEARAFEPIAPPPLRPGELVRDWFTDHRGVLFLRSSSALYRRPVPQRAWSAPLPLPGRDTREMNACGRVLIAVSTVDAEGAYQFRSFDGGERWSPFRLGALGLTGESVVLRCLGARGAIEVGRGVLPSHWSFDGGRVWSPAGYDDRARRIARERGSDAARCRAGPADAIECRDPARVRLLSETGLDSEIYAPARCEHITQLDTRTTVAFGPSCGVLVSVDRGGLWSQRSASSEEPDGELVERPDGEGRGGLVDARAAWRIDGSIWWTFDGGARWSPVASVIGRTLLRGVFVDRRRGVFVTRNGWVMSTRDGGRTFTAVLQGEVERISAEGSMVFVTTPRTVRISPDGGTRWWAPGVGATGARVHPVVERDGDGLRVRLRDGRRIEQRAGRVELVSPEGRALLGTLEDPRVTLLDADHDPARGARALLSDGTILRQLSATPRPWTRPTPR
jgi:hypothetical protein